MVESLGEALTSSMSSSYRLIGYENPLTRTLISPSSPTRVTTAESLTVSPGFTFILNIWGAKERGQDEHD